MLCGASGRWLSEEVDAMPDILIVGGGVIGLSLAYELAGSGARALVVDRGQLGREASWAGAGILPPAAAAPQRDPYAELLRISTELYPRWSAQLREETGVDNGYRRCGGVYLATDEAEDAELRLCSAQWQKDGIAAEPLDAAGLAQREPALADGQACKTLKAGWSLRDEAQVRNPRHLKALMLACARRGVELNPGLAVEGFRMAGRRATHAITSQGDLPLGQVCITGGPWSKGLLRQFGLEVPLRPVRGQMVLLASPRPLLRSVVNVGPRYLVPRADGRILVGSTEEDAGFDKRTTAEAVGGLIGFAVDLAPVLGGLTIEQCWAGLRPASHDGVPYLGRLPAFDNAFLATGHFRQGLQLSPGTAVVMSRLMQGSDPPVDLAPFRVDRG